MENPSKSHCLMVPMENIRFFRWFPQNPYQSYQSHIWLVVWNHGILWNVIIPTDFNSMIFQRGRAKNHQPAIFSSHINRVLYGILYGILPIYFSISIPYNEIPIWCPHDFGLAKRQENLRPAESGAPLWPWRLRRLQRPRKPWPAFALEQPPGRPSGPGYDRPLCYDRYMSTVERCSVAIFLGIFFYEY